MEELRRDAPKGVITIHMLNTTAQFLVSASSALSRGKSKNEKLVSDYIRSALNLLEYMGCRLR